MTLGAGDRSEVASGAKGRTGPKSLTALAWSGSRLPHNFFRSAGTPSFPLGVPQVGGIGGSAVGRIWRSRHLNQFFGLLQFLRIHEGPLPVVIRCRRHDGCGANAAVGARITSRCRGVGKSRTRPAGRKSATACGPIMKAERRYVGKLMYRRGCLQSNNLSQIPDDLPGERANAVPGLTSAFLNFVASRHAANLHEGTATCRFERRAEIFTPFEGENFA